MNAVTDNRCDAILDLAGLLAQQNDFQEIIRLSTQKAADIMDADTAIIMMINPQTRHTLKTMHREGSADKGNKYHFLQTNVSGWVIDNKAAFLSGDIHKDKRFHKTLFQDLPVRAVLCVPLCTAGIVIGTLMLLSEKPKFSFSEEDLVFMEKYAVIIAPFLRNVQQIEQYFTSPVVQENLRLKFEAFGLLGKSQKFMDLLHSIESASHCDVRVLIEGKSGTGKELVAKAIHGSSIRSEAPFIAMDCGAIPPHLMESELFGHIKGAFTGAAASRKGLFEEAHNGTLFMDEITNLPMDMQSKLLRVLQEGEFRPVGSNTTREVNVRVIAAAGKPLKKMVREGKFREDLFYRLMVYPVYIPALDERKEDIPLLANHFLQVFAGQQNKEIESFHEEIIDFMKTHPWSGNIRELENFVERMVTLTPGNTKQIDVKRIPPEFQEMIKEMRRIPQLNKSLTESLEEYEEKLIVRALENSQWNQSRAARSLKISEQTLRYKMQKLNIKKP